MSFLGIEMYKYLALILVLVVVPVSASKWMEAEKNIVRQPLRKYENLPNWVIKEFNQFDCTIPQTYSASGLQNVISGQFAKKGQNDWAALCSNNKSSKIVVLWGGISRCENAIAESKDISYLQGIGDNKIGYSRIISSLSIQDVTEFINDPESVNTEIPIIDHSGINNYFIGKGSSIYYCHEGVWKRISGAD